MLRENSKKGKKTMKNSSKVSRKTTLATNTTKSRLTGAKNSRKATIKGQKNLSYIQGCIKFHKDEERKENENQNMILNKELIKKSLKPNKWNFMNKISYIYDLVLAKVKLPDFVEYFLGDALYKVKAQQRNDSLDSFDWKLDDFKRECTNLYTSSEEEDLKHFMEVDLPSLNRWGNHSFSRVSPKSTKANRQITLKSFIKKPEMEYDQEDDKLDMLTRKLDCYLLKIGKSFKQNFQ